MNKVMNRVCPVCGGVKNTKIKNIKLSIPEEYGLPNNYDVVCCENCGFCYSNTSADNSKYDYYYTNFNVYSYEKVNIENEEKEYSIIKKIIDTFLTNKSNILNIGIGSGEFEKRIFNDGYQNIMGIDPSKISVQDLLSYGIKAEVGNVYNEPLEEFRGKFDAVFLQFTLEHLLNPENAIKQMVKYISNEGIVFISVPDYGKIKHNTTKISNNFNQEHINYFSRISLKNLFGKFGFEEIYNENCTFVHNEEKEFGIFQVYKHQDNIVKEIEKDTETIKSMKTYFKLQDEKNQATKDIINNLINTKEEIVIWGTGAYTMNLLANMNLHKCNITAYVDNNPTKEGVEFSCKNIKLPTKEILNNKTVLICSMLYSEDIKKQIIDMNVTCKIVIA